MTEKSILEQALLQVQTLEEAVKQNAKGILASTMKQELNDLLKESLEEEEEVATEEEETPMDEQPTPEEEADDMSDEDAEADDSENDTTDLDNEDPSKGIDSLDSEMGDDELPTDSESETEEPSLDDFSDDEEDVMDMTGASDDEVLKVFKAMKPEDGIVVKKDGNNVELTTDDEDYIIKLDDEDEMESETDMDEEEIMYEIELDEEEEEESKDAEVSEEEVSEEEVSEEEEESKEEEVGEAARTFGADVRAPQGKKYKAGRHEMNEEVENLKKQNAEYKKALVLFKEKLNEVAVFNANLAYATRLFTEHSTTKQEKLNILKRFDSVSTMNEAKNLFNTIKTELGTKTTVTETVVEKISNTPSTSTSQEVLSEAKAYENPQFKRMKDLMSKIK